ncbi:hypothetical protein OUZ56_032616 [Daphnia magna]|uniref:Uncharacterized protein n=1 Tax=Daphnia magna TaxID=35525 RepID=A0ABR0B9E7_9CRUS|nr:hypothetical protein OUZ56_032616 [Daphnia magna]
MRHRRPRGSGGRFHNSAETGIDGSPRSSETPIERCTGAAFPRSVDDVDRRAWPCGDPGADAVLVDGKRGAVVHGNPPKQWRYSVRNLARHECRQAAHAVPRNEVGVGDCASERREAEEILGKVQLRVVGVCEANARRDRFRDAVERIVHRSAEDDHSCARTADDAATIVDALNGFEERRALPAHVPRLIAADKPNNFSLFYDCGRFSVLGIGGAVGDRDRLHASEGGLAEEAACIITAVRREDHDVAPPRGSADGRCVHPSEHSSAAATVEEQSGASRRQRVVARVSASRKGTHARRDTDSVGGARCILHRSTALRSACILHVNPAVVPHRCAGDGRCRSAPTKRCEHAEKKRGARAHPTTMGDCRGDS